MVDCQYIVMVDNVRTVWDCPAPGGNIRQGVDGSQPPTDELTVHEYSPLDHSEGMKTRELARAEELIDENLELIRRRWNEVFHR